LAFFCLLPRVCAGSCGLRGEAFLPTIGRFFSSFAHSLFDPPQPAQVEVRKARPSPLHKSLESLQAVHDPVVFFDQHGSECCRRIIGGSLFNRRRQSIYQRRSQLIIVLEFVALFIVLAALRCKGFKGVD
jgi:hypothetical protein